MTAGAWARSMIGPYQLAELVGAGGMGEVYRAVHLPTRRTVAVKVLTSAAGLPGVAERFQNEARVQAAMRHPNIAVLYELLEEHGTPCIAMEFVDGETLEQRLRRTGSIPIEEALALTAAVVDAVGYLHGRGVIHRDIKTANVKVSSAGVVKLLDFGIAKGPDSPALTRTGNIIGTLQSLAPEQLEHGRYDNRTDIWALGVLLHELLTSKHPFADQGMFGITDRIRAGRFKLPSRVNPLLPSGVDRIVARCLKVDPAQRYPSCEAMLTDIRALLEPAPSGAMRIGPSSSEFLDLARSRGPLGAAILAAGLAVAFLVWSVISPPTTDADMPLRPSPPQVVIADPGRLDGGARSPGARVLPAAAPLTAAVVGSPSADSPIAPVREVTVNALNGTADVYKDESYVGRTPYLLSAPIGTAVSLVLRRTGYEDAPVQFDVTEGKRVYSITLRRRDRSSGGGAASPPQSPSLPPAAAWLGIPFLSWRRRRGDASTADGAVPVTGETSRARDSRDDIPGESEMLVGLASDTGCVRDANEDSVRVVRPAGADALARRGLLAVVCDGMGGHAAGETASRLAADVVASQYASDDGDPGDALVRAVQRANRAVFDAARADASIAGMGTTCTAVVLRGGRAWCAHVGDSRCYLIRDGQLYLMTEDHSAVMELVRQRSISRDEARHHPDRNVVSRAIGSHRRVEISAWPQPFVMRPGDRLLLSSDGLHDLVSEQQIMDIALLDAPQQACQKLVKLARDHGAPDNVSVILLELPVRRAPRVVAGVTRELLAIVDTDGTAEGDATRGNGTGLGQ